MDIIQHSLSTITNMVDSITKNTKLIFNKNMSRFSHASVKEIRMILEESKKCSPEMGKACILVVERWQACEDEQIDKNIINKYQRSIHKKGQANFLVISIRDVNYFVINMICCPTIVGIRMIISGRSAQKMRKALEPYYIYCFGAPSRFSAYPEFIGDIMQHFVQLHGIK